MLQVKTLEVSRTVDVTV